MSYKKDFIRDFVRRTFLSIFACEVSLLDAAKPTMTVARLLSLLARIACSFVCYQLIAFGTCPIMNAQYSCFSSTWEATTTATATATVTMTVTMTATEGGRYERRCYRVVLWAPFPLHVSASNPAWGSAEWEKWEGRKWIGWQSARELNSSEGLETSISGLHIFCSVGPGGTARLGSTHGPKGAGNS